MHLYMLLGTWLLLWPCGWSLALATPAGSLPDPALLAVFGLGALVMRGAGCTINDMWDRNIDHAVERTRNRPITSGQVCEDSDDLFLLLLTSGYRYRYPYLLAIICTSQ